LARVVSWPARGTHATCTRDGLAGTLDGLVCTFGRLGRTPEGLCRTFDGLARRIFAVRAVNSSDKPLALTVTSPAAAAMTGGAEPDAVSVRGLPREMGVAGDLRPRQIAVTCLAPSVTLMLRLAVSLTAAAFGPTRLATAARGRVTAIPVPVGWTGWPGAPAAGKVAVTSVLTGRDAEPSTQV
jgi:hypothetical protein